jgi:hypothetical protein
VHTQHIHYLFYYLFHHLFSMFFFSYENRMTHLFVYLNIMTSSLHRRLWCKKWRGNPFASFDGTEPSFFVCLIDACLWGQALFCWERVREREREREKSRVYASVYWLGFICTHTDLGLVCHSLNRIWNRLINSIIKTPLSNPAYIQNRIIDFVFFQIIFSHYCFLFLKHKY